MNGKNTEINNESITSKSITKELVGLCLDNWLGYGNSNGKVWFIGTEEGGAEIWRFKTQSLESSLTLRSKFKLQMDFVNVWEEMYEIPLAKFKGPTVWRFIAACILGIEDQEADPKSSNDYVFIDKKLGRLDANHFLCEFLPLPKQEKLKIEPYKHIWKTIADYKKKVSKNRFKKISDTIILNNSVKLIVSYESSLSDELIESFKDSIEELDSFDYDQREQYSIHKIQITPQRDILLLRTPFFGQGRISYVGLSKAIQKVKGYL